MKKILSILLVAAMTLAMTGCAVGGIGSSSSNPPASKAESSDQEDLPEAASSEAVAPEPTPAAHNINLLTGEGTLSPEAIGKRPVAVMVNNATANLPQYGISDADLIFEIPVEGEATRLMAMYGDYTKVPEICSIRSCRYYFPILSTGFDALYIHWGADEITARPVLNELKLDNIDGIYEQYGLFDRDQDRLDEGYALEHTSRFHGPDMAEALKSNSVRVDLVEDKKIPAFQFNEKTTVSGTEDCTNFTIQFDTGSYGYYSDFSYDAANGSYLKTHNEKPHMDGKTHKQLSFTNVLVLETEIGLLADDGSLRKKIEVLGKNKVGTYMSGGKRQSITWSKADATDTLRFYDASGNELELNKGRTYIGICTSDALKLSDQ